MQNHHVMRFSISSNYRVVRTLDISLTTFKAPGVLGRIPGYSIHEKGGAMGALPLLSRLWIYMKRRRINFTEYDFYMGTRIDVIFLSQKNGPNFFTPKVFGGILRRYS